MNALWYVLGVLSPLAVAYWLRRRGWLTVAWGKR